MKDLLEDSLVDVQNYDKCPATKFVCFNKISYNTRQHKKTENDGYVKSDLHTNSQ